MSPRGNNATEHLTSEYLETQRQRISETRDQLDGQRLPLLRYGEEQRDSVEIALGRFDDDIAALESNLVEQRKILIRMMTDMRSESFGAIQGFLEARATAIAELAAAGITDYGKLAAASQTLHDASDPMVSQSVHNQAVLESTAGADATLLEALHSLMVFDSRATLSRTAQSSSGPRSLLEPAPSADAPTELEADEQTEETIGDSGATLSPTAGSSFGTRSLPEPAPSADALTELEADEQTEETIGQIG
jgi:hypothetical protein